jgi:hypothetical protein
MTDQFWQYAKETILSVAAAKTDEDKQGLLELAQTWTRAALLERQCTPLSILSSPGAKGTHCGPVRTKIYSLKPGEPPPELAA